MVSVLSTPPGGAISVLSTPKVGAISVLSTPKVGADKAYHIRKQSAKESILINNCYRRFCMLTHDVGTLVPC